MLNILLILSNRHESTLQEKIGLFIPFNYHLGGSLNITRIILKAKKTSLNIFCNTNGEQILAQNVLKKVA